MQKRVQFPSLNGLRFIAAFGVLVSHVEQKKFIYGLPSIWHSSSVDKAGQLSVSLFFVLSGFLITFLLLEESELFKSISIRKFYVRRILRIWPLYYIIVLLGFFVLPFIPLYQESTYLPVWDKDGWLKALLYFIFSPHVAAIYLPAVAYAGPLWSVGVEEWFYAFWPWIVKYARSMKALTFSLLGVIFFRAVACLILPVFSIKLAVLLIAMLRFDCMAIGGLFALMLKAQHQNPATQKILSILYRKGAQILTYLLLAVAIFYGWDLGVANQAFYSVLFGIIILNLATNKQTIVSLENPVMHWLGSISYGVYCYNWIAVVSAFLIIRPFISTSPTAATIVLPYVATIILNIALAAVSYEFIERRFLLLKQRSFTKIPSLSAG